MELRRGTESRRIRAGTPLPLFCAALPWAASGSARGRDCQRGRGGLLSGARYVLKNKRQTGSAIRGPRLTLLGRGKPSLMTPMNIEKGCEAPERTSFPGFTAFFMDGEAYAASPSFGFMFRSSRYSITTSIAAAAMSRNLSPRPRSSERAQMSK